MSSKRRLNIQSSDAPTPEKKPKKNQYLPLPQPRSDLLRWVHYYWHLGFSDKDIANHVMDHFNREEYGISYKSVQRMRNDLQLLGTRQRKASFETIMPYFLELRGLYPNMGARAMVTVLRQEYGIKVPEWV
ncbi:hypothetical protein C8J55DRAFT_566711 [Lentinula edodes]|uniref:Uncharacterized protein n=1 Tax=Lentinula lateritia TaxID=40482 RepID=A0A9W8ZRZ7_9AGAR|nr:hypothetical protein C8J55DRAFT_566711 [Lentinula edodes]